MRSGLAVMEPQASPSADPQKYTPQNYTFAVASLTGNVTASSSLSTRRDEHARGNGEEFHHFLIWLKCFSRTSPQLFRIDNYFRRKRSVASFQTDDWIASNRSIDGGGG
jgi:hypothetical protein